ncbi:MAG: hypothetical protein IPO87_07425 [Flavobacteriales bacterium]|nr:hypothetical protein [Flavobacteriales bacterium]
MLNCNVSSIMLVGTGNGTFAWSGPNGFSSTVQNPNVGAAGTYNLVVTGANGCTSDASTEVTQDAEVPGATAQGGVLNCNVSSIMLVGTGNGTFAWSGPNGFSSTVQNPNVGAAGTYNLVVTGANGCTSDASTEVTQDAEVPGATAQGGVLNCNVSSIMLVGTGNGTFAWSGPNGFSSTVQNPNVGAAGIYNLVVTGTNGCTSNASTEVTLDEQTPGATAQGGVLNCNVSSIMLVGTGNGTFAWSGPNGFSSTVQNPNVGAAGIYNLVVTGTNGCTSNASAAGTYNLVVTGANGCTSDASTEVTQDAEVPGATAQGGVLNCNVSSIMLVGTGNGTFAWSGPNGFSSTVQNPNVGAAGIYNLVVTGTNGCTSNASTEVTLDEQTPGATAQGGVLNCNVSSIMLVGTGNGTFAWSGPNGFSSTVQNPNVGAAGIYNLVVTGTNGCTSNASTEVTLDEQTPGATAQGGVLNCNVSSIMLVGTGNGTFAWSGPNGFSSTMQNPNVGAAGTYNVVTGANGCTSDASTEVTQDAEVPGATAQGGVLNCNVSSIMLVGTGNGTFAWSGPNGFSSTVQNPNVGAAGTYNLVVTGANGCTSDASTEVT